MTIPPLRSPALAMLGSLSLLAGCAAPGEFADIGEAARASQDRHEVIHRIRKLSGNYRELWNDADSFEAWKEKIVPELKNAEVTNADLHHRDTSSSLDSDGWSDSESINSKTILYGLSPKPKIGEVRGGFCQIPGRFVVYRSADGNSVVRTSRGKCQIRGQSLVIHSYDFFQKASDYWLRCTFFTPAPEP